MDFGIVLLAGISGTLIMTGFTESVAFFFKKPFHDIRILSIMLPFQKKIESPRPGIYLAATLLHYLIGVIFTYFYQWQLMERWIINDLLSAFLYGGIIGSIAVIGWRIYFSIHPNPPPIDLKSYLLTIWFGHIALSMTAAAVFDLFFASTPMKA